MPLLGLLLTGCTESGTATVLSAYSFEWQAFNHRLSHLSYRIVEAEVQAAVVGGASTTGQGPEFGPECDPATCQEFPFTDTAKLTATVSTGSAPNLVVARQTGEVLATAAGASVSVPLQWDIDPGEITPMIAGFRLDSTRSGDGCYDASFGWLPRRLAIELVADETDAVLSAWFEAGLSHEEERACLDEAVPEATLALTVDIVAIAGVAASATSIEQAGQYTLGSRTEPDEQPPPDAVAVPGAVGWSAWDWQFHQMDTDGRGAYLRASSTAANDDSSAAASNYSPGTQLSGFDFAFVGQAVAVDWEASRHDVEGEYTPTLDADGDAQPTLLH